MGNTSDVPVEVVVAAFNDEDGAEKALKSLKEVKKEGYIAIQNAAVLRKDDDGKIHIKETADMSGGKGAVVGGVIGGVVGLIFPPSILFSAAAGAAVGGLAAKLRDSGFPDERLRQVAEGLKPNTSALIAVIEHVWVLQVEQELREYGADVVTEALQADIAAQLEVENQAQGATSGATATSATSATTATTATSSTTPTSTPASAAPTSTASATTPPPETSAPGETNASPS